MLALRPTKLGISSLVVSAALIHHCAQRPCKLAAPDDFKFYAQISEPFDLVSREPNLDAYAASPTPLATLLLRDCPSNALTLLTCVSVSSSKPTSPSTGRSILSKRPLRPSPSSTERVSICRLSKQKKSQPAVLTLARPYWENELPAEEKAVYIEQVIPLSTRPRSPLTIPSVCQTGRGSEF